MKILYFTNSLSCFDGLSTYSHSLVTAIAKKHDVLCLVNKREDSCDIKQVVILKKLLSYFNPLNLFIQFSRIRKEVEKFNPDIIHFLAGPYALFSFFLPRRYKIVLTVLGTYAIVPLKISPFFALYYYKHARRIISISNYTKQRLKQAFPNVFAKYNLADKICVIPCGIEYIERKPKESSNHKIIFVGAVKPRKGLLHAIEAINIYKNTYGAEFTFDIIGSLNPASRYCRKIISKIDEYELNKNVNISGRVDAKQLEESYKQADLLLMLSVDENNRFEGFGLVFLEANSHGVPVIGSINSGCQEAIKDGFSGYVVDPFDYEKVAEKIYRVLDKGEIKRSNCIKWAEANSISKMVPLITKLYEEESLR